MSDEGFQIPKGFWEADTVGELIDLLEVPDQNARKVSVYFGLPEDEFDFELYKRRPDPNSTFSEDGVRGFMEDIRLWAMCRVWKRWKQTKKAPQKLVMQCTISWE